MKKQCRQAERKEAARQKECGESKVREQEKRRCRGEVMC